jgi:hypothetical protein
VRWLQQFLATTINTFPFIGDASFQHTRWTKLQRNVVRHRAMVSPEQGLHIRASKIGRVRPKREMDTVAVCVSGERLVGLQAQL